MSPQSTQQGAKHETGKGHSAFENGQRCHFPLQINFNFQLQLQLQFQLRTGTRFFVTNKRSALLLRAPLGVNGINISQIRTTLRRRAGPRHRRLGERCRWCWCWWLSRLLVLFAQRLPLPLPSPPLQPVFVVVVRVVVVIASSAQFCFGNVI